jgi:hypothetical protein
MLWDRTLLEEPTVTQLVKKISPPFTESEGSLPCSQPSTGPYPEPDVTSPFPRIHSNVIFTSISRSSKWSLPLRFYNQNIICIFTLSPACYKSRDSSVGITLDYGLDDRGSRIPFPAGAGNFSLHHRVRNGSGAHPASYPTGIRGSFPGGKAAGA